MLPLCPLTPYGGAAVGSNINFTPLRIWAQGPNDIPHWLGRVPLNLAAIPRERERRKSSYIPCGQNRPGRYTRTAGTVQSWIDRPRVFAFFLPKPSFLSLSHTICLSHYCDICVPLFFFVSPHFSVWRWNFIGEGCCSGSQKGSGFSRTLTSKVRAA